MRVQCLTHVAPRDGATEDENEDVLTTQFLRGNGFFAAVLDGHGVRHAQEPSVVEFVAKARKLLDEVVERSHHSRMFPWLFNHVHHKLKRVYGAVHVGAVAGCVLIEGDVLTVAHAGDVRLYVNQPDGRGHPWTCLTRDHTADDPAECERLWSLPGREMFVVLDHVLEGRPYPLSQKRLHHFASGTISPGLYPTRGFGDSYFRPALTHEPEVSSYSLHPFEGRTFALCSDGGRDAVERTFRDLWVDESMGKTHPLGKYQHDISRKLTIGNDDDASVVLFRSGGLRK